MGTSPSKSKDEKGVQSQGTEYPPPQPSSGGVYTPHLTSSGGVYPPPPPSGPPPAYSLDGNTASAPSYWVMNIVCHG